MRRALTALGAGAFAASTLAGCTIIEAAQPIPAISRATWTTFQALPNYDGSPATQADPAELERLRAVLEAHDVRGDVPINETGCGGQITIDLDVALADGREWHIARDTCQDLDPFAADLRRLLADWDPRLR